MSNNYPEQSLRFFSYQHLPEKLQPSSKIFADMAATMLAMCPTNSAQRVIAFNKLLECKDAFVRAGILHAEVASE